MDITEHETDDKVEAEIKVDPSMIITGETHEKAIEMCKKKMDCPHHRALLENLQISYIALLKAEIAGLKQKLGK